MIFANPRTHLTMNKCCSSIRNNGLILTFLAGLFSTASENDQKLRSKCFDQKSVKTEMIGALKSSTRWPWKPTESRRLKWSNHIFDIFTFLLLPSNLGFSIYWGLFISVIIKWELPAFFKRSCAWPNQRKNFYISGVIRIHRFPERKFTQNDVKSSIEKIDLNSKDPITKIKKN